MKRRKLLKHLRAQAAMRLWEGTRHTHALNLENGRRSEIPRHPEIDAVLVRTICKQLGIPIPTER